MFQEFYTAETTATASLKKKLTKLGHVDISAMYSTYTALLVFLGAIDVSVLKRNQLCFLSY